MALTQSIEATSKLIDYLAEIEVMLASSEPVEVGTNSDPDVDIGSVLQQLIENAEDQGLFVGRQALQHTLETIRQHLSILSQPTVNNNNVLSTLFTALKSYLHGVDIEQQIQTIVNFLPTEHAEQYATMLFNETVQDAGETTPNVTAMVDSRSTSLATTERMDDIPLTPDNDISPLPLNSDQIENASDSPFSPDGDNDHPIKAALNLAVEDLHALLNSEASLPAQDTLEMQLQEHLDNLEFIAQTTEADDFLSSLETLQNWAQKALSEQNLDLSTFLSELLVKLANLPYESVSQPNVITEHVESEAHQDTEVHDSFSDQRLAMLYEELSDLDEQLARQALIITSDVTDGETLLEYIENYSELLGRLANASDALGLHGLKRICNFVIENVNLLPTQDADSRIAVRPLLSRWPAMVKHYLTDPSDDSALLGLIDLLQESAWPNHFDGLDGRDLYSELSRGAAEEEEIVSEETRATHATEEDVRLDFSEDVNPQLLDAFLLESPDVASRFNQVISTLNTTAHPIEEMRSAQRLSHTLKGSANLVGIKGIANLAHHIEDILDVLTRKQLAPSASLIAVLHEAADCLESMIDAVAGRDNAPDDARDILQHVLDIANHIDSGAYDPSAELALSKSNPANPAPAGQATVPTINTVNTVAETIRVPTATVDAMFRLVEEITISLAQVNEHVNRVKQRSDALNLQDRNLQQRRFDLENLVDVRSIAAMQKRLSKSREDIQKFDPLEMDQYDELYGATHSYIEAVADAREISNDLHEEIQDLDGFLLRQSRLNKELQQLVSSTRMVPVSDISNRLQRAVRQASRATGNAAELVIDHRNLMMDGDVLNKLVDPLMHILRNAVDHGMSHADETTEPGRITVRFHQEGSNIVISCSDNGRGLNYQRIREVAVEQGLIRPEQELSKEELARFIMSPAFTTRSSTTQVSGRGIGMDAVFSAVIELKGTISVHDVEPQGTQFVIRLPLSLVTTHSLVVQSGANIYAIPSATLSQILSPGTGKIQSEGNENSFLLDGENFSMHLLAALLGYESGTTLESSTILLTGHDAHSTAIAVDAVLQSTELVVKRLGRFVPKVTGVAGVTVLGDGRVIPVLDLPELLLAAQEGTLTSSTSTEKRILRPAVERPTALVVDDSLSARNSLSQLLEDTGYAVLTARDGVEAVELLQVKQPLVVLADLEMPRMDGIELTRHIRSNEKLQQLPVLMITSRSQNKHRQEAESAGVNAYLTKPFKEDELIDVVASLV